MAEPLRHDPEPIAYAIRRSPRARRVRVVVEHDGEVVVVLPRRARDSEAAAAVVELRPWIERRLREAAAVRERVAGTPGTVPYLGEELVLVPERGRTRVHRRGDELLVPSGTAAALAALERWYRRAARAEIAPRLDRAVDALDRSYTQLTIRNQRTRWGSCSATGAMSFNWRLLLAPEEVLDYVVWHEACHLLVLDHSPRFWRLLEHHLPGYRDPRRWLRANGAALVLTP
jgi:predicted metal-dependent hydrolase